MGARVTLALGDRPEPEAHPGGGEGEVLPGRACSPSEPRESGGLYWGYTTRLASGLSAALSDSPFEVCLVAHCSVKSCVDRAKFPFLFWSDQFTSYVIFYYVGVLSAEVAPAVVWYWHLHNPVAGNFEGFQSHIHGLWRRNLLAGRVETLNGMTASRKATSYWASC